MGISAELKIKVENAISDNKLVGESSFCEEEYETLLEYTREYALSYSRGIGSFLGGTDYIHFITLVEIAKRWKRIEDDENDESGFWEFVFKTLIGFEGYDQKLYKAFTDLIGSLGRSDKILFVDYGKKYWAALMMHAFAPIRSIYAFLDLCYNIYRKDLDFNYTENDKGVCEIATIRFCEILQSTVGNDKTVSIGSNTYAVKIGLRTLALNSETQDEFVNLLHKTLEIIDNLFYKYNFDAKNYFEEIVFEWWKSKLSEVRSDRKTTGHRSTAAVTKQNIRAKFNRFNNKVFLVIPPIRINDKGTTVCLSVYEGEIEEQRLSEKLFTKIGELTVTTKQKEIDLNDILCKEKMINIRVEISENGITIYDKKFYKEFLLFDDKNEVHSQINKADNYFLYTRDISALKQPAEISGVGCYLYNIYPKIGESLVGELQQVFFVEKLSVNRNQNTVNLIGNLPNCKWYVGDIGCMVFSGSVRLLVPKDTPINGMDLTIDTKRYLLSELPSIQENDYMLFDIGNFIPICEPTELEIYSHIKEKLILHNYIVVFPKLDLIFAREVFYGKDEKKLTISFDNDIKVLSWDITQSQVIHPFNDGDLIINIPYLRWRLDGKDWYNESNNTKQWYKSNFHNGSILEIDSPQGLERLELIAVTDGVVKGVECNTSGNFEIGKFIFRHENSREILFLLKNADSSPKEIFIVSTAEHFTDNPILYSDGKLLWQPEDTFVGDKSREFCVSLTKDCNKSFDIEGLSCSDEEIEVLEEGVYKIKITSQEGNIFKKERKTFYEGEIIIGRKEKFRFFAKHIKLVSASAELSGGENSHMYWKPLTSKYFIENLHFVEIDNVEYYIGDLYTINAYNKKILLNKMINEKNKYDRINPVRIFIATKNTLELVAGHNKHNFTDCLGTLSYDMQRRNICNINVRGELSKNYPCINYYKFIEVENV